MLAQTGPYLAAFEILSRDFRRVTEFVEPTDDNAATYSHRIYELLLRVCTEFESACKEALVAQGSTKSPKSMNVNDYKTLEGALKLEGCEVGIVTWQPRIAYVRPFDGWTSKQPPLGWYAAYNQVKHNRNTDFKAASLENLRLAIAGLFATLAALDVIQHGKTPGVSERAAKDGAARERCYPGHIFTIIC